MERPKVRFSHPSLPKVKSVLPLNYHITYNKELKKFTLSKTKNVTEINHKMLKESQSNENVYKSDNENCCTKDTAMPDIGNLSLQEKNEEMMHSKNSKHFQTEEKENCNEEKNKKKLSNRRHTITAQRNIECIDCFDSDSDIEVVNVITKGPTKTSNKPFSLNRLNKTESNSALVEAHQLELQQLHRKLKSNRHSSFPSKTIKHSSKTPSKTSSILSKSNTNLQVMPCAKFRLQNTPRKIQEKITPKVSKSTVINAAAVCPKACIIPASKCIKQDSPSVGKHGQKIKLSQGLLDRPEYNSSVPLIKKYKELEKERVIRNKDELPSPYKNLINGKVSMALNFPTDEPIYKNLVNLSVDEAKFQSKLLRSKDPPKRDKETVPCLSDFYQPRQTQPFSYTPAKFYTKPNDMSHWTASKILKRLQILKDNRDKN